ncbi:hypothetical protein MTO96_048360 [Rhipicephalus appendiculatus]
MISLINHMVFFVRDLFCLYILSAYYLLWECLLRIKSQLSPQEQISYRSMVNKTVVVTGGSGGIGHETMRALLSLGARVIDGSPDATCKEERKRSLLEGHPTAQVDLLHLDLSSMASVKLFAEEILKSESKIDALICNAGVMLMPYRETEDGFESHMSINYLGHCLLTALLLPLLISASSKGQTARIVNVSSCVHKAGRMNIDDLNSRKTYSCYNGYAQSKLAQLLVFSSGHQKNVLRQYCTQLFWASLKASVAAIWRNVHLAQPLSLCDDHSVQERLWNKTWALLRPWLNDQACAIDILLAS